MYVCVEGGDERETERAKGNIHLSSCTLQSEVAMSFDLCICVCLSV